MEERAYASEEALGRGRIVISSSPPATSPKQALRLAQAADAGKGYLAWEAPPLHGGFASSAEADLAHLGTILYTRLPVQLPRQWISQQQEGVFDGQGLWMIPLLERLFGPVHSIAVHSRCLLRTQHPTEDMGIAHIEFSAGTEGALEIHGLGENDSTAQVQLQTFGVQGVSRIECDLQEERRIALQRQYLGMQAQVADGQWHKPEDVVDAVTAARWLRQAARLGQRLYRRDKRQM